MDPTSCPKTLLSVVSLFIALGVPLLLSLDPGGKALADGGEVRGPAADSPRPTPAVATVITGGTVEFTADQPVAWSIKKVAGVDTGLIDELGRYTAPSRVPPSGSVTVKAASRASGVTSYSTVFIASGSANGIFDIQTSFDSQVVVKDFDGDGRPDLLDLQTQYSDILFYKGTGGGTFSPVPQSTKKDVSKVLFRDRISFGDLNGDGKLDIVGLGLVSTAKSNNISLLWGKGDGIFVEGPVWRAGSAVKDVKIADFDGDGLNDLVVVDQGDVYGVTSSENGKAHVFLNKGAGTFGQPLTYSTGGTLPIRVETGDLDGDGRVDLIVADSDGIVATLLNQGGGIFAEPVALSLGVSSTSPYRGSIKQIALADLDVDGRLDLVVTVIEPQKLEHVTRSYLGDGKGSFIGPVASVPSNFQPFDLGHTDGDDKVDLIVTGPGYHIELWKGNGTGDFTFKRQLLKGPARRIEVTELNGDSNYDLIAWLYNRTHLMLGGPVGAPPASGQGQAPLAAAGERQAALSNQDQGSRAAAVERNDLSTSAPQVTSTPAPQATSTFAPQATSTPAPLPTAQGLATDGGLINLDFPPYIWLVIFLIFGVLAILFVLLLLNLLNISGEDVVRSLGNLVYAIGAVVVFAIDLVLPVSRRQHKRALSFLGEQNRMLLERTGSLASASGHYPGGTGASSPDLARVTKERDQAIALREQAIKRLSELDSENKKIRVEVERKGEQLRTLTQSKEQTDTELQQLSITHQQVSDMKENLEQKNSQLATELQGLRSSMESYLQLQERVESVYQSWREYAQEAQELGEQLHDPITAKLADTPPVAPDQYWSVKDREQLMDSLVALMEQRSLIYEGLKESANRLISELRRRGATRGIDLLETLAAQNGDEGMAVLVPILEDMVEQIPRSTISQEVESEIRGYEQWVNTNVPVEMRFVARSLIDICRILATNSPPEEILLTEAFVTRAIQEAKKRY